MHTPLAKDLTQEGDLAGASAPCRIAPLPKSQRHKGSVSKAQGCAGIQLRCWESSKCESQGQK